MTTNEVADKLGCTRQMVGNYIRWARLRATIVLKDGIRQYDIDPESVDQFIKLPPSRVGRPRGAKNKEQGQ